MRSAAASEYEFSFSARSKIRHDTKRTFFAPASRLGDGNDEALSCRSDHRDRPVSPCFPPFADSGSWMTRRRRRSLRMQMPRPVTPAVINKAGFVAVLSPAATRRDEGGISSLSPLPSARARARERSRGTPDYKTLFVRGVRRGASSAGGDKCKHSRCIAKRSASSSWGEEGNEGGGRGEEEEEDLRGPRERGLRVEYYARRGGARISPAPAERRTDRRTKTGRRERETAGISRVVRVAR